MSEALHTITAADLLAGALDIAFDDPPETFDPPRTCVITGEPVSLGYRARDIIPSSTSEFLDLLHGDTDGIMSVTAARVYKSTWN